MSLDESQSRGSNAADEIVQFITGAAAEHFRVRRDSFIVGICGSQGSGKSTACNDATSRLASAGLSTAVLSLDDLYISPAARTELALNIHPLLRTRGVPGTHDVELGHQIFQSLGRAGNTAMPRFDKALDMPVSESEWTRVRGPVDVILFEGWCVGARPQAPDALITPANALERECDAMGNWRRFVNGALAGPYQGLFARLDKLILMAAPDFNVVAGWRQEQERSLRARLRAEGRSEEQTMDDAEIDRFVQHYERLTRHILSEMPARADCVIYLDGGRGVVGTQVRRYNSR